MDTEFAEKALGDMDLYWHIAEHRRIMTPLRGIDYANHAPVRINIIPPASVKVAWERDYNVMRENMIYEDSLPYDKLIERIVELNRVINKLRQG
jgi:hypothetical protein